MNETYQLILEAVQDGIVIIQKGVIVYANPYMEKSLGYKNEGLEGRKFTDFIATENREEVLENYQKTIKGELTVLYEAKIKTKEGDFISVEINASKITYKGEVADLAVIRDIKARKKTEEIFQTQEERFHAVTDNTPDIIARFDEECRYVYVNAAAEREFGIPRKDFFWKTDKDLGIANERSKSFSDAISAVFSSKSKKTFYSQAVVNGSRKYYYTVLVPEFFKDGTVNSVLSITRDITEIKEIDQAKSEFISITSHQLRSPLSVINWCAICLLKGDAGELKEEQKDYLEKIYDSARNLIKITDAFLNTTMLDLEMFAFNHQMIDVTLSAKEMINNFKKDIEEKEINFVTNYEEPLLIEIDQRVLRIILRGIISNAIEYTPREGDIEVETKKLSENEIIIRVKDSGCGIPKKDQRKVFSKFYRAEIAKEMKAYGTGLDLYLIKSLLEKMGGSIEIESPHPKFNKGSAFSIKLPISSKKDDAF